MRRTGQTIGSGTEPLPDELESPQAKLVYLYLASVGRSTLSELQAVLEMKKTTLLSVLGALADRDLIDHDDGEYAVTE